MLSKQTPGVICFLTHIKRTSYIATFFCTLLLLLCNFYNTYINIYNANVCVFFLKLFTKNVWNV